MTDSNASLTARPAWKALITTTSRFGHASPRAVRADPGRGERLVAEAAGIFLDYSKNRITDETLMLLLKLAEKCGLRQSIDAMFRGETINITENRAVLHVALRAPRAASIVVDGENVVPQVHAVLDKMTDFCNRFEAVNGRPHRQTHP